MKTGQLTALWLGAVVMALLLLSCSGGGAGGGGGEAGPSPSTGISLLAGGLGGYGYLDATATEARFNQPGGLVLDSLGNIWVEDVDPSTGSSYYIDGRGAALRTVDAAGMVKTVSNDARPRSIIGHWGPSYKGPVADGYGNVYESYWGPDGGGVGQLFSIATPPVSAPDLPAYRQCRTGGEPGYGFITIDRRGALYCYERLVTDFTSAGLVKRAAGQAEAVFAISGFTTDGDASVARFSNIGVMVFDAGGNGFFTNTQYYGSGPGYTSIRRITPQGAMTTLLPGSWRPEGGYLDGPSGVATANRPAELQLDAAGSLYFSDTGIDQAGSSVLSIRRLTPAGDVSTLAGPFPGGTSATVNFVVDAGGGIYRFEQSQLVKIDRNGVRSAVAGTLPQLGSRDGAGSTARFAQPLGVAADGAGNVYVADYGNHTVRKIDREGNTVTLAGKAGQPGSDDGPGEAARFIRPRGIAADSFGNLYVTHGDSGENASLRRIDVGSGAVTTVAVTRGLVATAVAVDPSGKVYTNDIPNQALRVYDPRTQTLGMLAQGMFRYPPDYFDGPEDFRGIAADGQGRVYVLDTVNYGRILKIDPSGNATSLPGAAATASFSASSGMAIDAAGNLYVADPEGHVIRKVTPDGSVSTVVGASTSYYVRPGALPGSLGNPTGIAVRPSDGSATHLVATDENSVLSIVLPR